VFSDYLHASRRSQVSLASVLASTVMEKNALQQLLHKLSNPNSMTIVLAHNVSFEYRMLQARMRRYGLTWESAGLSGRLVFVDTIQLFSHLDTAVATKELRQSRQTPADLEIADREHGKKKQREWSFALSVVSRTLDPALDTSVLHDALIDCERTMDLLLHRSAWKDIGTLEDEVLLRANAAVNVRQTKRAMTVGGGAAVHRAATEDDEDDANDASPGESDGTTPESGDMCGSDRMDMSAEGEIVAQQEPAETELAAAASGARARRQRHDRTSKRAIESDSSDSDELVEEEYVSRFGRKTRRTTKRARQSDA
jgi:hypothetical protein